MWKCTISHEPRVLSSPSLNKKQSTLSRFFTPKNEDSKSTKRASDCVADDLSVVNTKRTKLAKDLDTSTLRKLSKFKNGCPEHEKVVDSRENSNGEPVQKSPANIVILDDCKTVYPKTANSESILVSDKVLTKTVNLTPLEKQVVDIKAKYSDAVLLVECGYRFRFFGDDAKIAANILNITCHQDHNFMTASIPVHRLNVHVRRLVEAGYKVGVVQQTETAALKAVSENKNTPFSRQLTALYTRSTLVGEEFEDDKFTDGTSTDINNFLMCIMEDNCLPTVKEDVHIGAAVSLAVVAVQPLSGNVVHDVFKDGTSRQELEMRLEHIAPVDLLLPEILSPASKKCIQDWISRCGPTKVRVEEVPSVKISTFQEALATLENFYNKEDTPSNSGSTAKDEPAATGSDDCGLFAIEGIQDEAAVDRENHCLIPSEFANYPEPLIICLSVVLGYLKMFKLENVLKVTSNFTKFFKKENTMKLPSSTIRNLEIFSNQTDNKVKGSLFWVLDRTLTSFGKRQLNTWISQPLTNLREIERRQEAITEIVGARPNFLDKVKRLLRELPDLDKGLCVINHRKCSPARFYNILVFLTKVQSEITSISAAEPQEIRSPLLRHILRKVTTNLSGVNAYLNVIDEGAAKRNVKVGFFKDDSQFPEIKKWREKILEKEDEIRGHRKEVAKVLQNPRVEFVTVSGNEYLIEIKVSKVKSVPLDWIKISSTKTINRYRTPFVEECYKTLCQYREHLSNACQDAWLSFLSSFGSNYEKYSEAIKALATLDCLVSLAEVADQHGYTRPRVFDKAGLVHIRQGKHPVVDILLSEQGQYVPNDTKLESGSELCMIITGPNMGGKSSYVRQVALICIMAQIGSFVPVQEAELGIIDCVYTRMGANDNIYKGRSTFMNELQETSDILKHATSRSLVILDELGRGTSTHDGTAIAYATLSHIISNITCPTLFITHYPSLANIQLSFPNRVSNYHMAFIAGGPDSRAEYNPEGDADSSATATVTFLYSLAKGVAKNSYGLNVAKLAEIPSEVLQKAARKSLELQNTTTQRRHSRRTLRNIWNSTVEELKGNIRELTQDYAPKTYPS